MDAWYKDVLLVLVIFLIVFVGLFYLVKPITWEWICAILGCFVCSIEDVVLIAGAIAGMFVAGLLLIL